MACRPSWVGWRGRSWVGFVVFGELIVGLRIMGSDVEVFQLSFVFSASSFLIRPSFAMGGPTHFDRHAK
jgi:hypothetical protein